MSEYLESIEDLEIERIKKKKSGLSCNCRVEE